MKTGDKVKVAKSFGSKIKGGSIGTVVEGPIVFQGIAGVYVVEFNGIREEHHGQRLAVVK